MIKGFHSRSGQCRNCFDLLNLPRRGRIMILPALPILAQSVEKVFGEAAPEIHDLIAKFDFGKVPLLRVRLIVLFPNWSSHSD
jgi:hypothetical protein